MRLFVAVAADALAEAAAALVAELRARTLASCPRARVTWLRPDHTHLTLAFIGQLDDERVPAIRQALVPPLSTPGFRMEARGLGAFPDGGRPRVLWCGIGEGRAELVRLAAEVEGRLRAAKVPLEAARIVHT